MITLPIEYRIESCQKRRFPSKCHKKQRLLQKLKTKTMWEDTSWFSLKCKTPTMWEFLSYRSIYVFQETNWETHCIFSGLILDWKLIKLAFVLIKVFYWGNSWLQMLWTFQYRKWWQRMNWDLTYKNKEAEERWQQWLFLWSYYRMSYDNVLDIFCIYYNTLFEKDSLISMT